MEQLKIIAISGASGSGKSALIKELAVLLACDSLHFDDFIDASTYPPDMRSWLAQGADVNLIKTASLTRALHQAKVEAATNTNGPRYLLVEEPFGRQRLEMASLIDRVVLLNPPAELCLSRVIQRNLSALTQGAATDAELNKAVVQIGNYLRRYDEYLRLAYQTTVAQVAQNSDLQINDIAPINQIAATVQNWLLQQELVQQPG